MICYFCEVSPKNASEKRFWITLIVETILLRNEMVAHRGKERPNLIFRKAYGCMVKSDLFNDEATRGLAQELAQKAALMALHAKLGSGDDLAISEIAEAA